MCEVLRDGNYGNHAVSRPQPPVPSGRVLDYVVDVAALVVALGQGEAQAALLRLHQRHVQLHLLAERTQGTVTGKEVIIKSKGSRFEPKQTYSQVKLFKLFQLHNLKKRKENLVFIR